MACDRHHEALIEVALGARELHPGSELSAHLAGCTNCRSELDAQRRLAAAIDSGVAASVDAEPSPAFAARVHQRIAAETAPAPAWWQGIRTAWMPLAVGVLTVVLLAFWLARRQPIPPPHPGPEIARVQQPSTPMTSQASSNLGTPPHGNAASVSVHTSRSPHDRRVLQTPRTNDPEVIVFPGEREAVLKFYTIVRNGRTDASALVVPASDTLEIKDLKIAPLEVPALDPVTKPGDPANGNPSGIERPDSPRRL
jgi:hypothetical protein